MFKLRLARMSRRIQRYEGRNDVFTVLAELLEVFWAYYVLRSHRQVRVDSEYLALMLALIEPDTPWCEQRQALTVTWAARRAKALGQAVMLVQTPRGVALFEGDECQGLIPNRRPQSLSVHGRLQQDGYICILPKPFREEK